MRTRIEDYTCSLINYKREMYSGTRKDGLRENMKNNGDNFERAPSSGGLSFEWRFYAMSVSKAIFRAIT